MYWTHACGLLMGVAALQGKTYHNIMEVLLGDGIFNSDGENWRKQRKTASHEFNRKTLSDFSAVVFRDYALKLAQILHQRHTSDPLLVSDMQVRVFSRHDDLRLDSSWDACGRRRRRRGRMQVLLSRRRSVEDFLTGNHVLWVFVSVHCRSFSCD